MKKVLVFGAQGMVGSRVVDLLRNDFEFVTPDEKEVNITDNVGLKNYLSKQKPQIIINFAAITDINFCETERENEDGVVWKVNALAPGFMSQLSLKLDYFMIQISTDMVFAGLKADPGPYNESHPLENFKNLTWYGASKAEGEKKVLQESPLNAVVRIIYPVRSSFPSKLDYARKITSLYDENKLYPMFSDQFINITYIDEFAEALKIIINNRLAGIYHVASSDTTTPFELASYLLQKSRGIKNIVRNASLEVFVADKDPRRYPQFGGLKTEKTQAKLKMRFSTWEEIIEKL